MSTAIVDLDNTLVECNSFTEFVKFSFKRYPKVRILLIVTVILRKLRIITHEKAKNRILDILTTKLDNKDLNDFINILINQVNHRVLFSIKNYDYKILATAAPSLYAEKLGKHLGFDKICSSESGEYENRSLVKLKNVMKVLHSEDMDIAVFTDHHDDLPLLNYNRNGLNYLVKPSSTTRMIISAAGINYIII